MALKTPPLHAKGVYQLELPWVTDENTIYECIAIRDLADFVDRGQDAFKLIYEPKAIALGKYNDDKALGVNIITLAAPNKPTIQIPDTYILAYPAMDNVAYNEVILSASLGALPDSLDLTFLLAQVAGTISDTIGVVPTVKIHLAPSTGVVSSDEHEILEVAREAAIVNRVTDRAKVLAQQITIDAQAAQIATLEQYLRDADLLPP